MISRHTLIICIGAIALILLGIFSWQYYQQIAYQKALAPEVKGTDSIEK